MKINWVIFLFMASLITVYGKRKRNKNENPTYIVLAPPLQQQTTPPPQPTIIFATAPPTRPPTQAPIYKHPYEQHHYIHQQSCWEPHGHHEKPQKEPSVPHVIYYERPKEESSPYRSSGKEEDDLIVVE